MDRPIIEVEGISKRYRLGAIGTTSLRDAFSRWWERDAKGKEPKGEFWALRDVSFSVQPGEVVGIIGRNGAGKSTLLKILSHITEPTSGRAVLRGRMTSLLEVGTGFHPDLTGRENIFLNGAILGMTRAEIRRKFDEIVAFSEVEEFIDTPVKRYSSGMYVRLAFAVAAHLEPEILVIDEVLSVGDAQFQKKCLGKMREVSGLSGKTVLFVSHNLTAVRALCTRGICLHRGRLVQSGDISEVVGEYLRESSATETSRHWSNPSQAPGNDSIRLDSVRVDPPTGEPVITVDSGALIEVVFSNQREGINLDCTAYLSNADGILIFESGCIISSHRDSRVGSYRVSTKIPSHLLNSGLYSLRLLFGQDQRHELFQADNIVSFSVENTNTGRGANMAVAPGVVRPLLEWKFIFEEPKDSNSRQNPSSERLVP